MSGPALQHVPAGDAQKLVARERALHPRYAVRRPRDRHARVYYASGVDGTGAAHPRPVLQRDPPRPDPERRREGSGAGHRRVLRAFWRRPAQFAATMSSFAAIDGKLRKAKQFTDRSASREPLTLIVDGKFRVRQDARGPARIPTSWWRRNRRRWREVKPRAMDTRRLRLLSANIQAGSSTRLQRLRDPRSWSHVLPAGAAARARRHRLPLAGGHDIVGPQESDRAVGVRASPTRRITGRTRRVSILEPRTVAPAASPRAPTACSSRSSEPMEVLDHPLPGGVRAAALLRALRRRRRRAGGRGRPSLAGRGVAALNPLFIGRCSPTIATRGADGDFNCSSPDALKWRCCSSTRAATLAHVAPTFLAWRPQRDRPLSPRPPTSAVARPGLGKKKKRSQFPLAVAAMDVPVCRRCWHSPPRSRRVPAAGCATCPHPKAMPAAIGVSHAGES